MQSTIESLLTPGKGILAADESFPTIEKRLKAVNVPSTEPNRHAYRQTLFTTPGLNQFISGVILFDETMRQKIGPASIPEFLAQKGIVPGIKVDLGTAPLPMLKGEKVTEGLHGLRDRLAEYRKLGARFTKWRAVIKIGDRIPTKGCIDANATMLALFAGLSQEAGLVPIVEPEVLMDGDHGIDRCEEVTFTTLRTVFDTLIQQNIILEEMLLKTGMVLSGKDSPDQAGLDEVASATIRCLLRAVPAAVPGIVFLSGGQSDELATERLNAICQHRNLPWRLTFSYGRALQDPAIKAWKGNSANVPAAQEALLLRAKANGAAVRGLYSKP
jgi:fructose-bisphosphate aldolase class I